MRQLLLVSLLLIATSLGIGQSNRIFEEYKRVTVRDTPSAKGKVLDTVLWDQNSILKVLNVHFASKKKAWFLVRTHSGVEGWVDYGTVPRFYTLDSHGRRVFIQCILT